MSKQISSLSVVLSASVAPFVGAFQGLKGVVGGFTSSIASAGGTLLKFTGIGTAIGATFAALKGAASGISLAAELEQTSVAFETMLGSADAAKAMMQSLTDFSASTPFEFPEIATAAKQLLAFGVSAQDMTGKLTMLGDISAGIGKPIGDLAAIYGKVKSRGQLTGETLNQLAESGVPIYKALAAEMGVTTDQVAGLVTAGKIGFPQVDAALGKLTATGGQFSGMMAKQSKTLAGLWSTLTDNVGLAAAGLVTTVVDAFGLRDALAAFTTFVGNAGTTMNAFVSRIAPVVVGWANSLWSTITGIGDAVYAYVAPLLAGVYGVFASRWQGILATTVGYAMSLYDVVRAALTAAWTIVGAMWTGIVGVWQWACDLIGYQTADTGTTVGNAFSTIVDAGQWLQSTLTQVFTIAAYAINNFATIVEYAGASIAYQLVSLYNAAAYYFGAGIEYVKWFAKNLGTILLDGMNNAGALMSNGIKNVVAIVQNLPGLLAGTTDLSDVFTPLTDGFVDNASKLPTIAARIPGELEQALSDQSQGLGDSIVDGLVGSLNDADKRAAAATKGVTSAVAGVLDQFKPPTIDVKASDPSKGIAAGATAAADAVDDLDKKTRKAAASWEALAVGSQVALATHASDAFSLLANAQQPSKKPAAASRGGTTTGDKGSDARPADAPAKGFQTPAWFAGANGQSPTAASPPVAPAVAPMPAAARDAMAANGAKAMAKDKADVELLSVTRMLLAQVTTIARDGGVALIEAV